MGNLKSLPCPTDTVPPDPTTWDGNLQDLVEMQQNTIRFLITQYNAVLQMVSGAGGAYGAPTSFVTGATIPSGWWQLVAGTGATVTIDGTVVNLVGTFWSDGTATSNGANEMVMVGVPGGAT